ncbi:MAG: SDR family NAD(P)-dependent oxidoreductase, partial [Planctomycetota bacterium]|nr:SDR family NAD(P)-dependent oxidoreductase [Planctomycetota bacterium]
MEKLFVARGGVYNAGMDLTGKTALVTGAARRVGRSIALALARAGADVAVHYHRSAAEAESLAGEIRRLGRRAECFPADLADPAAIEGLFAALAKAMPPLLVLVNNASTYPRAPRETLTAQQWDAVLAVNARAPALCIRHAAAIMTEG